LGVLVELADECLRPSMALLAGESRVTLADMPRYLFWHSETGSVTWLLDRAPEVGEVIVLSEHAYRILQAGEPTDASVAGAYICDRRPATDLEWREHIRRGVNRLYRL
jgi:hypothetical protein